MNENNLSPVFRAEPFEDQTVAKPTLSPVTVLSNKASVLSNPGQTFSPKRNKIIPPEFEHVDPSVKFTSALETQKKK